MGLDSVDLDCFKEIKYELRRIANALEEANKRNR